MSTISIPITSASRCQDAFSFREAAVYTFGSRQWRAAKLDTKELAARKFLLTSQSVTERASLGKMANLSSGSGLLKGGGVSLLGGEEESTHNQHFLENEEYGITAHEQEEDIEEEQEEEESQYDFEDEHWGTEAPDTYTASHEKHDPPDDGDVVRRRATEILWRTFVHPSRRLLHRTY